MDVKCPLFEGKEDSLLVKQFVEKEGKLMLPAKTNQRLETLGTLAKQGKRINGLFRLMADPYLWVQAYINIYPNKGAVTPGVNGTSLDGMSYKRICNLILAVKNGEYHFSPARRVQIPKSNGKSRPLGIPEGNDKIVQEVIRMILEKIYEPIFSNNSHGFRHGRSCHTALTQVREKWTGMKWIINMDIKGYFDNIDHEILMALLEKYIDDKRFLTLIRFMLKAGYMEDWKFIESYSGSPQGNHASPILANIYLHELDEFMGNMKTSFWKGKQRTLNPEYHNLSNKIQRRMQRIDNQKKKGNTVLVEDLKREIMDLKRERELLPSALPMDANYRRMEYIRYADDFLIGIIGTKEEAKAVMQKITQFLREYLHLKIAEEKSGVIHASEGTRFLGYDIRTYTSKRTVKVCNHGRHTTMRSARERMQLHIPPEKLEKFCKEKGYGTYHGYKARHRTRLTNNSEAEIVTMYNGELRGLANYYSLATNAKRDLGMLYGIWQTSLIKTLAAKRKSTVTKVAHSLKRGNKMILVIPNERKEHVIKLFKLEDMKDKVNTYNTVDVPPMSWEITYHRSELIQRLNARKCEYCGKMKNVTFEVHHKRKLSDIKEQKHKWQRIMIARRRKTLVLCEDCHHKLHTGTLC